MSRYVFLIWQVLVALIFLTSSVTAADKCFNSSKKLNDDAQSIRLAALDMGWKVGKSASLAAAGIVKGKAGLYPQDNVEICLRQHDSQLQIKVESKSKDAGKAEWRKVIAKKQE